MENMKTKVARAIWHFRREDEDRCDVELEDLPADHSVWHESVAAIEAMREPTVSMLTAGEYADSESNATGNATNIWRDMIDAALAA